MKPVTETPPAPSIALLFADAELGAHLRQALQALGARIVHEGAPAAVTRSDLDDSGADVVVVNLDESDDDQIDHLYDVVDEDRQRVVFNDASASRDLSGWDRARWARHLAAKLVGSGDVDPPRPASARPVETVVASPGVDAATAVGPDLSAGAATDAGEASADAAAAEWAGDALLPDAADEAAANDPGQTASDDWRLDTAPVRDAETDDGSGEAAVPPMAWETVDVEEVSTFAVPQEDEAPAGDASFDLAPAGDEPVQDEGNAPDDDLAFLADFATMEPTDLEPDFPELTDLPVEADQVEAGSAVEDEHVSDVSSADTSSDQAVWSLETVDETSWQPGSIDDAPEPGSDERSLAYVDTELTDAIGHPPAAPGEDAMPAIPPSVIERQTESSLPPVGDWDLVDFDTQPAAKAPSPAVKEDAAKYGIEKMHAADYLAPTADGGESPVQPGMTLELVSMEEAIAPRSRESDLVNEMFLDASSGAIRRLIVLAAGSEGAQPVREFVAALNPPLRALLLLVQHHAEGDAPGLVATLEAASTVPVRAVQDGLRARTSELLVLPAGHRCQVDRSGRVHMQAVGVRDDNNPSIDDCLTSAASTFGADLTALIFAGDTNDALAGAQAAHDRRGHVWVQDPTSCEVNGMAAMAIEDGLAEFVGTPTELAARLNEVYA